MTRTSFDLACLLLAAPLAVTGCGLFGGDDPPGGGDESSTGDVDDDDDDDDGPGSAGPGSGSDPGSGSGDPSTSGPSQTSGDVDDETGDDETTGGPSSDPEGPIILELSSNITELGPESTVRITAIVTDPDGIEDVIGGSLTNQSGSVTYGALATSSQEGAYTIELSWAEINLADPIEFTGSLERSFIASFFDTAGHETSEAIALTFACEFEDGACDGQCMYLSSNSNCGGCGVVCEDFDSCQDDECVAVFSCNPLDPNACSGSLDCHTNGTDYACTSSGDAQQGDTCDGGALCDAGMDCYGIGGEFSCYTHCVLEGGDCPSGTQCEPVTGVPIWEDQGICI